MMTAGDGTLDGEEQQGDEPYGLDAVRASGEQRMPVPVPSQSTAAIAVTEELDRVSRRIHRLPTVQAELGKVAEEEGRREARRQGWLREEGFRLKARTELKRGEAEAALREGLLYRAFDDGVQAVRPQLGSERAKKAFDERIGRALEAFGRWDDEDDGLSQRVLGEIQLEPVDLASVPIPWWSGLAETVRRVPIWAWLGAIIILFALLLLM